MIKQSLLLFILQLFLLSCIKEEVKKDASRKDVKKEITSNEVIGSEKESALPAAIQKSKSLLDWDALQDSLRFELLKRKENESLKSGILQELYLRNLVHQTNDSIHINIPFNLHGLDCGAPDCYTTFVKFSIKAQPKLKFPKNIPYKEYQTGCVSSPDSILGNFEITELTENAISLYNSKQQRLLIILRKDDRKQYAYYFQQVSPGDISSQTIDHFFEQIDEEDENAKVPYRSTVLTKNDYQDFFP